MIARVTNGTRWAGLSSRSGIILEPSSTDRPRLRSGITRAADESAFPVRALTIHCRVPYSALLVTKPRAPRGAVRHLNEPVAACPAGVSPHTTDVSGIHPGTLIPAGAPARDGLKNQRTREEPLHVECHPRHRCQLR